MGGMRIKDMDPDNRTDYVVTDDEGNDTGEVIRENRSAEARFDPLFDNFSNKEIARGASALDINNINKEREIAAIADYLNNQAGSSDEEGPGNYDFEYTINDKGRKIFSSEKERAAFQDRKSNRVAKRLAQAQQEADQDRKDSIVPLEKDEYMQASVENTAEMFDDMDNPGGGYAQYYPGADTAFESSYQNDPTKDLLNNYIAKILQDKADRTIG